MTRRAGEPDGPVRVVLVDDHDLVREGLRSILAVLDDIEVVGEASDVATAIATIGAAAPDLVLLDLGLGDDDGNDVSRHLRTTGFAGRILVLSGRDTPRHLRDALAAGADGYLLKTVRATELAQGMRDVVRGETVIGHEFVGRLVDEMARGPEPPTAGLTPREQQVLELVAEGLPNRAVGERLGISTRTAQKHVENLFKKLDVSERTELVAHAFRRGLIA